MVATVSCIYFFQHKLLRLNGWLIDVSLIYVIDLSRLYFIECYKDLVICILNVLFSGRDGKKVWQIYISYGEKTTTETTV